MTAITLSGGTWASYNGGERGVGTSGIWGGAGADTFILNGATISGDIIGENTAADTGKDIITLNSGTVMGNIDGRAGADEITINGADVMGYLLYGEGDIVTLRSGALGEVRGTSEDDAISLGIGDDFTLGFIDLRGGDDSLTLTRRIWTSYDGGVYVDGSSAGSGGAFYGGAGADTFVLNGAWINDIMGEDTAADSGKDTFMLTSGYVFDKLDGRAGADEITINGANVTGYLVYGADDIVTLTSGLLREVRGTAGAETIIFDGTGTAEAGRIAVASGFTLENIDLQGGGDTITIEGVEVSGYLVYGAGDLVTLTSGSIGELRGTAGAETLAFGGTAATGRIGLASTFGLGFIDLQGGDDSLTLSSRTWAFYDGGEKTGASIEGALYGGLGADTLILEGATITGNIIGDDAADTITLTSGTVGTQTYVDGGGGADTITLGFGEWAGYESGTGSTAKTVYGGGGGVTFTLRNGATLLGNVIGSDFTPANAANPTLEEIADATDFFTLTGTVGGYVDARGGDDSITLGGGTLNPGIWLSYDGGSRGSDESIGKVWGGAGADTLIVDGATISGNIIGDDEADTFILKTNTVGGYVEGGGGEDEIRLLGGSWVSYGGGSRGSLNIGRQVWGGAGADTFILDGATMAGNILGDGEADTITLTSGTVGPATYINAGGGADTITLGFGEWAGYRSEGGNTINRVYGGGGADTLILDGARINGNIIGDGEADTFML